MPVRVDRGLGGLVPGFKDSGVQGGAVGILGGLRGFWGPWR